MAETDCSQCDFFEQCPIERTRKGYHLDHTAKARRLDSRRKEEATEVFRERYKIRGGIEGTNSGLKRKNGLGQLRVRGKPAVYHAIYFKIAGWNIERASVCAKIREIVWKRANMAILGLNFGISRITVTTKIARLAMRSLSLRVWQDFENSPTLQRAA